MWEREIHKKGNRKLGWWLRNTETGVLMYAALKTHKDIFKSMEPNISEAMRKGVSCWGVDDDSLRLAKIKGATFIAIKVKDTGSFYVAPIDFFYDTAYTHIRRNLTGAAASKRYLPLARFMAIHKMAL